MIKDKNASIPYWRLSGFYLFYFSGLGALIPFWGLYLKDLGYEPVDIGLLVSLLMGTKIVAPYFWAWIADHTGNRMNIIRLASFMAAFCFAGVFFGQGFWWMVLIMLMFSSFWNATLPQFEATTMNYLGKNPHQYSVIRLWGSVGFIITVLVLGSILEQENINFLPVIVLFFLSGIFFFSLLIPESTADKPEKSQLSIFSILRQRPIFFLLLVCFLMQMSHGPYYTFFSIYLENHHYSRVAVGQFWALGVIAEIVIFLWASRIMMKYGARLLLLISLGFTVIRWLLIAYFVDVLPLLLAAQVFHAASFGLYHAVAISMIHKYFTGKHQGRGQAIYSSVSFGLGGAAGSYLSGIAWVPLGASFTFAMAGLVSFIGFVIAWKEIRS